MVVTDSAVEILDRLDIVTSESSTITETLNGLAVICRALACADEIPDGISHCDLSAAFLSIAWQLEHVLARVATIHEAAREIDVRRLKGGAR